MMAGLQTTEILIRKLRKKLRQIENLERLNRSLTEEERVKLESKDAVRSKLHSILAKDQKEYTPGEVQAGRVTPQEGHRGLDKRTGEGDRNLVTEQILESFPEGQQNEKSVKPSSEPSTGKKTQKHQEDQGKVRKYEPKAKRAKPQLSESSCRVSYLDGHSDLVTAVVVVGEKVVTASRDTTLKCWDITHHKEICSYGGHTETVTSLLVLGHTAAPSLPENDKLLISGSFDSTFKLWSLNTGQLLRSVYTYNPVVRIAYCFTAERLVTGSDGGKLELWNLSSGENTFSSRIHGDAVTGLKVVDNTVYSSASDGIIRIHQVTESDQLVCMFVSETVKTSSGEPLITRHICSLEVLSDLVFFGDDARNVKILDWKKGLVSKVPNHTSNFASTDALTCHDDLLLSSSFDLDQGIGYINVYNSTKLEYLATIDDQDTDRIVCLDFGHKPSGNLFVVTGGMDLKLWEVLPAGVITRSSEQDEDKDFVFSLEFRSALAKPAVDSEIESSDDDESDTVDQEIAVLRRSSASSGWLSWCSVL